MSSLDFSIVAQSLPFLWSGLLFSLSLTAAAFLIGMLLGTCFALVQHFELPVVSQLVRGYVALIRSNPIDLGFVLVLLPGAHRPWASEWQRPADSDWRDLHCIHHIRFV